MYITRDLTPFDFSHVSTQSPLECRGRFRHFLQVSQVGKNQYSHLHAIKHVRFPPAVERIVDCAVAIHYYHEMRQRASKGEAAESNLMKLAFDNRNSLFNTPLRGLERKRWGRSLPRRRCRRLGLENTQSTHQQIQ